MQAMSSRHKSPGTRLELHDEVPGELGQRWATHSGGGEGSAGGSGQCGGSREGIRAKCGSEQLRSRSRPRGKICRRDTPGRRSARLLAQSASHLIYNRPLSNLFISQWHPRQITPTTTSTSNIPLLPLPPPTPALTSQPTHVPHTPQSPTSNHPPTLPTDHLVLVPPPDSPSPIRTRASTPRRKRSSAGKSGTMLSKSPFSLLMKCISFSVSFLSAADRP